MAGASYLRCRLATAAAEVADPTGLAATGEVEDHQVTITQDLDFGDLPDTGTTPSTGTGNYQTLLADNGPRHVITLLRLGSAIDSETNGLPNGIASGDDIAGATPDDEDGVTFPALSANATAIVQVAVSNAPSGAKLDAFFDWNNDGDFDDAGEAFTGSSEFSVTNGTNNLSVPVPLGAVTGANLGARFRLSTAGGLTSVGAAPDGEVEDYVVTVQPAATGFSLGSLVWYDANNNGLVDGGETGISGVTVDLYKGGVYQTTATTDANGGYFFSNLVAGTDYQVRILAANFGSGGALELYALSSTVTDAADDQIDNDDNGAQAGGLGTEAVSPIIALSAGAEPMNGAGNGFEFGAGYDFDDVHDSDGDMTVDFGFVHLDYGDAPTAAQSGFTASYPVTAAQDGARHITTGPTLGSVRDAEANGQPNATATGDDSAGVPDDEDGVTIPLLTYGHTAALTVNASAAVKLDAWIDWNQDGDWADTGEQVAANVSVAAGNNTLNVPVPAGARLGDTFARFRLSTAGGLTPTGLALDGEVEDYGVTISPAGAIGNYVWLDENSDGYQDAGEPGSRTCR